LNPLLQTTIREIVAAGGVFDAVADYDELRALEALADRVVTRRTDPADEAALRPYLTLPGGVVLRRMTIGADAFLRERLHAWYSPREVRARNDGLAYVLAHADKPAVLWAHETRQDWAKAVSEWMRAIGCDSYDLLRHLTAFLRLEARAQVARNNTQAPPQRSDLGWLAATLTAEYGQTAEYWVWHAADHEVVSAVRRMREKRRQEAGQGVDANDPAIADLREFRIAEAALRARKVPTCPT
jgi:hypothetical protein